MLRTSVVPTILKAGFRMNVIPSEAEATIDVRALPDEDMTTFYQEMGRVIADPAVTIEPITEGARPVAPVSRLETDMYRALERVSAQMYRVHDAPDHAGWRHRHGATAGQGHPIIRHWAGIDRRRRVDIRRAQRRRAVAGVVSPRIRRVHLENHSRSGRKAVSVLSMCGFSVSASFALLLCLLGAGPCFAQQERGKALPRVWVLATGGAIAGTGASSTDLSNYRCGTVLGEDLVRAVPEIRKHADVKVEQIVNIAIYDMTLDNWATLAKRIDQILTDDPTVAGIVVTHGTSTLEETAYFLNLTVRHDRPVVLVGSMRPATAISADGPLNLLNAIRTASSPEACGKAGVADYPWTIHEA